jgi:hypothetical protein
MNFRIIILFTLLALPPIYSLCNEPIVSSKIQSATEPKNKAGVLRGV